MFHDVKLFGSLSKVEDQPDGTIKVFGVASSGSRDSAGEIITPDAMKSALPDYERFPALREMHQPIAAGKVLEADVDGNGITNIVAHVVDPVAVQKVKAGVYAAFSIGGKVLKRDPADRSIITGLRLVEISLVDSPCNTDAILTMWKADTMASEYKPAAADTIARAKQLAKAAGTARFKDFLFEAGQELVSEYLLEKGEIPEPELETSIEKKEGKPPKDTRPEYDSADDEDADNEPADDDAGEGDSDGNNDEGEDDDGMDRPSKKAATVGPDEDDHAGEGADEPAIKEAGADADAIVDPAVALAAALDTAKAAAVAEEPVADTTEVEPETVDYAKFATALKALQVEGADGTIQKSLYNVANFAAILDRLADLQSYIASEENWEGDNSSGVPAALRQHVSELGQQLVTYAQEEVAELVSQMGEDDGGPQITYIGDDDCIAFAAQAVDAVKANEALMEKAGARNSKADAATIQESHDATVKLGATCDCATDKAAEAGELEKLTSENERLAKALADAVPAVEELTKSFTDQLDAVKAELAQLRDTPVPPRTAGAGVTTVTKGADSAGVDAGANEQPVLSDEQFEKAFSALSLEEQGKILLKQALSRPMPVVNRS